MRILVLTDIHSNLSALDSVLAAVGDVDGTWVLGDTVGHTHVPLLFREHDGKIESVAPSDGSEVDIDDRRLIINPGGVGQPRDGDPRSCALILDLERMHAQWIRVEYPIEPVQRRMREL